MKKTTSSNDIDTASYAQIIDQYKDMAYSIAFKICNNQEDAEEIIQDAFLSSFTNIKNFRKESQYSTWLYRIVYHKAISKMRKNTVPVIDAPDVTIQNIEDKTIFSSFKMLEQQEQARLIQDVMNKLNPLDYTLITLYYFEEMQLKEIATVIGYGANYSKVLLQRARLKLHQYIKQSTIPEKGDLL